jgi:hypothetical protein
MSLRREAQAVQPGPLYAGHLADDPRILNQLRIGSEPDAGEQHCEHERLGMAVAKRAKV